MDHITSQEIKFIKLSSLEAGSIAEIEKKCFSLPWSEQNILQAFSQSSFKAFGLKGKDHILAYASVYIHYDELEILNIAVLPEFRQHGLGKKLLSTILQIAKKLGIVTFVLEVRVSNIPALKLYHSFGFIQVGIRPKYYADTKEDALVLSLNLHPYNQEK